jgi:choline kinase
MHCIMRHARSSFVRSVHRAIILAAGNGDRFHCHTAHSKLLTPVVGTPLLIRTLASAYDAGITEAHVVLGYDADAVRALATSEGPAGLSLHFHLNRNWHQENGVSVLAARACVDREPFALMMGDHIFEAQALRRLLQQPRRSGEVLLGIDRRVSSEEIVAEATKVRLEGECVTAIGKQLSPFDALDTGLFVCQSSVFAALEDSCADGDSTLTGGISRLARRGLVRGVDIGDAPWCDIDTMADLKAAEQLVGSTSEV